MFQNVAVLLDNSLAPVVSVLKGFARATVRRSWGGLFHELYFNDKRNTAEHGNFLRPD